MTSKVVGASIVIERMRRLREKVVLLATEEGVKSLLLRRVTSRFDAGTDSSGKPWRELSAKTIERKRRQGYSRPEKALEATQKLRRAIGIIQGSNAGILAGNTGLGFRIGVNDPEASAYGRPHNYGIGVPQREFMGVGQADVLAVRRYLARRMQSIAKE